MKKILALILALVFCLALFAGCSGQGAEETDPTTDVESNTTETETETGTETETPEAVTIKVGASPAPHAEILEAAKAILAEQGITLEIVEFDDYIIPNTALEEGELDANYFQHITYLEDFNAQHGTHIVNAGEIHYEPFAIYPGQVASLEELADGAKIAVPNDGTNEARALLLLEAQGLITLKEGVGLSATKLDIAENPHNFDIVEMEAKLLPSALPDVAVAIINGNYALGAGLDSSLALAFEDASASAATYVNIVAVKEGNENNEAIKALVEALKSEDITSFMELRYGSHVVPAK